jgi:hypothetical protein
MAKRKAADDIRNACLGETRELDVLPIIDQFLLPVTMNKILLTVTRSNV